MENKRDEKIIDRYFSYLDNKECSKNWKIFKECLYVGKYEECAKLATEMFAEIAYNHWLKSKI